MTLREAARKFLLRLLIWTEKNSKPVLRDNLQFWQRQIHIHPVIIIGVNALLIFSALVIEIGPAPSRLFGLLLFVLLSFTLFIVFLKRNLQDLARDNDAMMLLGILTSLSVLLIETIKPFGSLSPLLVPIAGVILLASLLLGNKAGMLLAIAIPFMCGILYDFKLEYLFYHIMGSLLALNLSTKIKHRQDITRVGTKIMAINVISVITLTLLGPLPAGQLVTNILWACANGIASIIFVFGLLSPLETFFSRITNIKLIELADFNQPLLKRLMMEAPGTYHHSLMVASVAEQAAEVIGANALLARVGAIYHDIGKIAKPEYFIENQLASDNPHDAIPPSMSGLVVITHVKEGVTYAEQQNLDKPIVDLIKEHHGTSLIYMFYQKALQGGDDAEESRFRYPGPKPKTKESAILMLADSCEAALRLLETPSSNRIKETVEKIINNKFTDGQLDEAPITLSDLHMIAGSMITTLTSIHHTRTEYERSKQKDNNTDPQS
ncbi:MAG: HDIG domain-containing protein [Elusimicrobia bacterium]|nr:HDIG domain-containing protein [Elusimicrobiota bacterium]